MRQKKFHHLTDEQVWFLSGEEELYGKEAEQYLRNLICSMNALCQSAEHLSHSIAGELENRPHTMNMILYALSMSETLSHIEVCCEMFLDEYKQFKETLL